MITLFVLFLFFLAGVANTQLNHWTHLTSAGLSGNSGVCLFVCVKAATPLGPHTASPPKPLKMHTNGAQCALLKSSLIQRVFLCVWEIVRPICACVSTDGAKMTKSTGVCSTVLWGLNTTDLCQSARHRVTVNLARTAMDQSGLTRWNVADLAVLYTLYVGVHGRYGLRCTASWCDMMVCLFVHQCPTSCRA